MPLNTRTVGWPLEVPASIPESIRTCSGIIALTCVVIAKIAGAIAIKTNRLMSLLYFSAADRCRRATVVRQDFNRPSTWRPLEYVF